MTALAWVDVEKLQAGDQLISTVGYSRAKYPLLATLDRQSNGARAVVQSVETRGRNTVVTYKVGTSTMSREWIPATILAVDTAPSLPTLDPARGTCDHCSRSIIQDTDGRWIDPEATGDDSIWRETCDENDTERAAPHEPIDTEQNGI